MNVKYCTFCKFFIYGWGQAAVFTEISPKCVVFSSEYSMSIQSKRVTNAIYRWLSMLSPSPLIMATKESLLHAFVALINNTSVFCCLGICTRNDSFRWIVWLYTGKYGFDLVAIERRSAVGTDDDNGKTTFLQINFEEQQLYVYIDFINWMVVLPRYKKIGHMFYSQQGHLY